MNEKHKRKNFTKYPNDLLNEVIISDLSKLEQKALLLILRVSYGCLCSDRCVLTKSDFRAAGISDTKIKKILEQLSEKLVIQFTQTKGGLEIIWNKEPKSWLAKRNGNEELLTKLIGKNLPKKKGYTIRNDSVKLHEKESHNSNYYEKLAQNYTMKEKGKDNVKEKGKDSLMAKNDTEFESLASILKRRDY